MSPSMLAELTRIVAKFAADNPQYTSLEGFTQDPWGAHAMLQELRRMAEPPPPTYTHDFDIMLSLTTTYARFEDIPAEMLLEGLRRRAQTVTVEEIRDACGHVATEEEISPDQEHNDGN